MSHLLLGSPLFDLIFLWLFLNDQTTDFPFIYLNMKNVNDYASKHVLFIIGCYQTKTIEMQIMFLLKCLILWLKIETFCNLICVDTGSYAYFSIKR